MDLAETIRKAITEAGTQRLVAREAGLAQQVVNQFMRGTDIRLSTATALCRALGLELRPIRRRDAR